MMDFRNLKKLNIGGVELKQLFINGIQVWKAGYKNWVKYSTESDGVTIYNGGLGYKDGYRVRSGGAEATAVNATCTGFIPVTGGETVRVGGTQRTFAAGGASQAINVYDASFNNLGQVVGNTTGYGIFTQSQWAGYNSNSVVQHDSYWEWVVPPGASGVAYIRVTGYTEGDGSKMVVTINEEIT